MKKFLKKKKKGRAFVWWFVQEEEDEEESFVWSQFWRIRTESIETTYWVLKEMVDFNGP